MKIEEGKPENIQERDPKEKAVYDFLEKLDVTYERVDHEPVMTMEECEQIEQTLGIEMCKNLFLRNKKKTEYYLLLLPENKSFDAKVFAEQVGCGKLSFAGKEDLQKYLKIDPGAVTVMGLMNDTENQVQLAIDRAVIDSCYIGCHPCVNTSSLKLPVQDLLQKILPAIHHEFMVVDLPISDGSGR